LSLGNADAYPWPAEMANAALDQNGPRSIQYNRY